MELDAAELARELARLRRGWGARASDLLTKLEPHMRQMLNVTEQDTAAQVRTRFADAIAHHLAAEPGLELAARAAFALHPEAPHRFLVARTSWLAVTLHCDDRTARRRVVEACNLLADRAVGVPLFTPSPPMEFSDVDGGWVVRQFRVVLRLDCSSPEAIEQRVIEFTRDGIDEVTYRFSLPRANDGSGAEHELHAEALYGVKLTGCERPMQEHFRFRLVLPRAFHAGEQHEYGFLTRIPAGQAMRPYYVYTPYRPCELFDLTVRFGSEKMPKAAWLLEEAVLPMIESAQPVGPIVAPDSLGEIRRMFRGLKQGLGYGLRWTTEP